jgi:hypothetical protein
LNYSAKSVTTAAGNKVQKKQGLGGKKTQKKGTKEQKGVLALRKAAASSKRRLLHSEYYSISSFLFFIRDSVGKSWWKTVVGRARSA